MGMQKRIKIAKQKRKRILNLLKCMGKIEIAAYKAAKEISNIGFTFKEANKALSAIVNSKTNHNNK